MFDNLRLKIAAFILPSKGSAKVTRDMRTATLDVKGDPIKYGIVGFGFDRNSHIDFALSPEDVGWFAAAVDELAKELEADGWDCPQDIERWVIQTPKLCIRRS